MSVSLSPLGGAGWQFFDNNGVPLAGGLLYTYAAGTTTPTATYTSSDGATPNANPIVLDSAGRAPSEVWLTDGTAYKFSVYTSANVLIRTWDDIEGINDPAGYTAAIAAYAATLAASGGSNLIGFIQSAGAAVARTVQSKLRETISVVDFGADPTGATDSTAALTAARNYANSLAPSPVELLFPTGIYTYSVSPNWGITNLKMTALGTVRMRYTGTGNAFIVDAGPNGADLLWNIQIGRFIIEAPTTAGHGVYIRSCHHCQFSLKVDGAGVGTNKAGIRVDFAVCSYFDNPTVSNNEGWYLNNAVDYGMVLTSRNPGETVSYCTIANPVIEGCTYDGIRLAGTLGNVFLGGTSEGNYGWGVYADAAASQDRFFGTDFEVNTLGDVYSEGTNFVLNNCDSTSFVLLQGDYQRIEGGLFNIIELGASATGCSVVNATYYRAGLPLPPTNPMVTTATTLSGSAVLTVASSRFVTRGMLVTGSGIPALTYVESCTPTTITLTQNTTGVPSGTSITFGTPVGFFTDSGTYTFVSNVRNYNTTYNFLSASKTWTPGTITTGSSTLEVLSVPGTKFGDVYQTSFSADLQGCSIAAYVSAANVVTVVIANNTGTSKTFASGTVRVVGARSAIL